MPAATRCQQENSAPNANARQADTNGKSRRPTPGRPCWARRRRALEGAVTRGAEAERPTGWESGYREGKGIKPSIPSSFCTPKQVVLSKSVVVCGNEGRGAPRGGPRRAAAVGSGAKRREAAPHVGDVRGVRATHGVRATQTNLLTRGRNRREATPLGAKRRPTSLQPLGRGDVECMVDPSPRAGKTIGQVALGV